MKAFVFGFNGEFDVEHNGKITRELPPVVVIAEDEGEAWHVLDELHTESYSYNIVKEINEPTMLYVNFIHFLYK